jgi:hypothetical protein
MELDVLIISYIQRVIQPISSPTSSLLCMLFWQSKWIKSTVNAFPFEHFSINLY